MNEELDLGRAFSVSIAQEADVTHRFLLPGNAGVTLYVWGAFRGLWGVSLLLSSQAYRLLFCLPFPLLEGADQLQSISLFRGSLLSPIADEPWSSWVELRHHCLERPLLTVVSPVLGMLTRGASWDLPVAVGDFCIPASVR